MGVTSLVRRLFRGPAKESVTDLGFGVVPDPGLANSAWFRQWVGIYQLVDRLARQRGGNQVERPLDERMLYIARGLMRYNSYAQGFINALRTHTIGANGLLHNPVGPSAKELKRYLTWWKKDVDWWTWEREIYERVHIEGDSVTRFFPDGPCINLRPIELETILAPDGSTEWTFGFYNEPGDVQDVTALNMLLEDGNEVVDHTEYFHIKSKLAVRADKRGRSDFLATAQLLDDSFKTWRNFAQSEAVRQGIIYFAKQAEGVTSDDITQAIAREADYTPPQSADGRRGGEPIRLTYSAGVEYLGAGTELAAPPGANVQATMTGVNAALLAVGRAYHMPLVIMSGDMSANNTIDFSDDSPYGASIQDEKAWYCKHVKDLLWRVVEIAVEQGTLPEEVLTDGTDIEVTCERKPAKDALQNTQRLKTLADDGIISKRERTANEGYDYDEQQQQIAREPKPKQQEGQGQTGGIFPVAEDTDGLVEKEIQVTRGSTTFTEKRMVRADKATGKTAGTHHPDHDASQEHSLAEIDKVGAEWEKSLTPQERKVVDGRRGEYKATEKNEAIIDKAVDKFPPLEKDLTVFRGLEGHAEVGQVITPKTHSSMSVSENYAGNYGDGESTMELKLPKGTKGVGAYLGGGLEQGENEFLLKRGTKVKITGKRNEPKPHQPNFVVYEAELVHEVSEAVETPALVEKEITVHRKDGTTFTEKRMVRPDNTKTKTSSGHPPVDVATLADRGFYLEDFHKKWLEDGTAELVEVPIEQLVSRDKEPMEDTTPVTVEGIKDGWKEGYRVPVPEGHPSEGKIQIIDGRHRIAAAKALGHKTIPMMVTKSRQAKEDTQLVTVHRGGKTFQEHRKKAATKSKKSTMARVSAALATVHQRAAELAVRLSPAAHRVMSVVGDILDTPEDMRKFAYNPSTSSGMDHANNDFVRMNMEDAFGVGLSGHLVASIVSRVLVKTLAMAKKRITGTTEDTDNGLLEFAEYISQVYKMVFEELKLNGKVPSAESIAANLAELMK